jgi:hypothetical protein
MPFSAFRCLIFLLPLLLSAQNQQSPSALLDLHGTLTKENVYSNPALGMTMVLPRKWQFVDKKLQARLEGSKAPRETPPDPDCAGPLCHVRINVTLITKPGQAPVAPSSPQLGARPKTKKKPGGGGPNPWLIAGAALAAGIFLAKWIDWRGDAHPRD